MFKILNQTVLIFFIVEFTHSHRTIDSSQFPYTTQSKVREKQFVVVTIESYYDLNR